MEFVSINMAEENNTSGTLKKLVNPLLRVKSDSITNQYRRSVLNVNHYSNRNLRRMENLEA